MRDTRRVGRTCLMRRSRTKRSDCLRGAEGTASMPTPASGTQTRVHGSAFGCITVPFLLIAIIPLAWGARGQWMKGDLLRNGEAVAGRVTELQHVSSNPSVSRVSTRGGTARGVSPVVAFATRAGEQRSAVGSVNRFPAPWAVGDMVDVVYDPSNPARADLSSEVAGWRLWFGIWCVVALLPFAIACLPIVLLLRQRSKSTSTMSGTP